MSSARRSAITVSPATAVCRLASRAGGGRDPASLADRCRAWWIAEEIGAPRGHDRAEPVERRPDEEQDQAHERKGADERIALAVNRHELGADGIDNRHVTPRRRPAR